jgi:hypothetical protein
MPDSDTKKKALRLLTAFHDLAEGKLDISVPVGGPGSEEDGAADRVGAIWDDTERDVALRYLLDQSYLRADSAGTGYTLTYQGLEQAREHLGLAGNEEGSGMSDKRQRQLMTLISLVLATVISQPITNYIAEQIPERRGIKDDLLEAALQGLVRAIAIFAASLVVRQIADRRQ